MNATHTHRSNTAITRLSPFTFALTLLLISLATTGCDFVDSNTNAEVIDAQPRWITPIGDPAVLPLLHEAKLPESTAWPVSHLIGTWVLTSVDIYAVSESSSRPTITFRTDGIFTGYAECYNFSGHYSAGSDWHLKVSDFHANQKFCVEENDPIRGVLFEGLRTATDFRFEHGTLWIMSGGGKREQQFIFERMEDGLGAKDIGMPPTVPR